jgi:hypothetical protein
MQLQTSTRLGKRKFGFSSGGFSSSTLSIQKRIREVASYGYNIGDDTKIADLENVNEKIYTFLKKYPAMMIMPSVSINRNALTFTEDFSNGVWTKQTGTTVTSGQTDPLGGTSAWLLDLTATADGQGLFYSAPVGLVVAKVRSIWMKVASGTGSVQLSQPDEVGVVQTCNLTTTWTRFKLTETLAGNGIWLKKVSGTNQILIWHPQVEKGSVATAYQPRLDATVRKVLNVGSLGATADGTFLNGTAIDMLSKEDSLYLLKFLASSSQQVNFANWKTWYPSYTYIFAIKPTVIQGCPLIKSATGDRLIFDGGASNRLRFNAVSGSVQSANGTVSAGVWQIFTVIVDNLSVKIRKAKTEIANASVTTRTTDSTNEWKLSNTAYIDGVMGMNIFIDSAITDAQSDQIYETIKGRYGLS